MQLASLVCWSGFQEGDRWREAFLNKMSHLFDKLLQYVPVDGAADQVGRGCEGGWVAREVDSIEGKSGAGRWGTEGKRGGRGGREQGGGGRGGREQGRGSGEGGGGGVRNR